MKWLFAALTLVAAAPVGAAGMPLLPDVGSSIDQIDPATYQCEQGARETRCSRPGDAAEQVAGEAVIEVVLFYRDGALMRSVLVLDEQRYDEIVAGLSQTLGAGEATGDKLIAGMAGVFDNRQHVWRHDGRVWMLEQFFERIIYSGLCVTGEAEYEALLAERDKARIRGARDL